MKFIYNEVKLKFLKIFPLGNLVYVPAPDKADARIFSEGLRSKAGSTRDMLCCVINVVNADKI